MNPITIIDTGICNISSVENAFKILGIKTNSSNSAEIIDKSKILILPGVGAFKNAMDALKNNNLIEIIRKKVIQDNVPILGICLGMQLLAKKSFENGNHIGLNLIDAEVKKLDASIQDLRVPNIGWHSVFSNKESILFKESKPRTYYHVHSYHMVCENENDITGYIKFGNDDITVAVEKKNIFGVQFHPEKSQDNGLNLLENFLSFVNNGK